MDYSDSEHVFIRVDADSRIGVGHLMRCLALAQAWKDAGGKATFITACQNEDLLQRLRTEEFEIQPIIKPYPDNKDWDHTRAILATHPMAWVVLDGYHFDQAYQKQVKEAGHRLMVIDDTAHLKHYYADIVLNQNLYAPGLNYSCEPGTILLLGTLYALLRREFLAWRNWKRKISEIAQCVLVTMGGSDPDNATLGVIQMLQGVDLPGLETLVIVGASNPHTKSLKAVARQSPIPTHIIHDARNMPELMSRADVAISAGGITAWELAFMALPTIFLVLTDNQRPIAESLGSVGAALDLGWYSEATSTDIGKKLVSFLMEEKVRADMSRKVKKIIDGDGSSRIISIMLTDGGGINADSLSGKQLGRMADS